MRASTLSSRICTLRRSPASPTLAQPSPTSHRPLATPWQTAHERQHARGISSPRVDKAKARREASAAADWSRWSERSARTTSLLCEATRAGRCDLSTLSRSGLCPHPGPNVLEFVIQIRRDNHLLCRVEFLASRLFVQRDFCSLVSHQFRA